MLIKLLLISLLLIPSNTISISEEEMKEYKLKQLLDRLAICESSNNQKAIRPNDPDAPSIGLYQWKIESYVWAGRRYGLPHSDIWNPAEQRTITKALISDGRGQQHFKNCFRKYNLNQYLF